MRTYRKSVPPKSGYVIAVWRPDGSLIASTSGPTVQRPLHRNSPEKHAMTDNINAVPQPHAGIWTEPHEPGQTELKRQLADAQVRIREMIAEIDRRDELIADLQRRIQELEQPTG